MKKIYSIALFAFVVLSFASFASAQDTLTYNLRLGMKNDAQVVALQNFLISQNYLAATNNTGFFGQLTFKAVKLYQSENSIDSTGFVGPKTRGSINAAISGGSVSYLPGCTSFTGFSTLTGMPCVNGQSLGGQTSSALSVTPVQISNVTTTSASLSSSFTAQTSSYYTVRFEYATDASAFAVGLQSKIGQIILSGQSGSFSASMANLIAGQTYYVRAVAEGNGYVASSTVASFVAGGSTIVGGVAISYQNQGTAQSGQPLVGTGGASSIIQNNATVSGVYDGRGSDAFVAFQYWTGGSAISTTTVVSGGPGAGSASVVLPNLIPGTTYSYRIIASNVYGSVYGTTLTFTTLSSSGNSGGYTGGYTAPVNTCSGAIPNVTASLDASSATGTILTSATQVALMTANLVSDCDSSLKSLTFSAASPAHFTSLTNFSVYLNGNTIPLQGTFSSAGVFTLTTPILLNSGTSNKITLRANTPSGATGTVKFGLISATATSSTGIVNQYSISAAGNTLTFTYSVNGTNPGGTFNGGTGTGTGGGING